MFLHIYIYTYMLHVSIHTVIHLIRILYHPSSTKAYPIISPHTHVKILLLLQNNQFSARMFPISTVSSQPRTFPQPRPVPSSLWAHYVALHMFHISVRYIVTICVCEPSSSQFLVVRSPDSFASLPIFCLLTARRSASNTSRLRFFFFLRFLTPQPD